MSYFGALAEGAFKRDASGRPLFFPWGSMGAGRVIPGEADRERIHGAVVRMHQAGHVAAIPLVLLAPVWLPFALLPLLLGAYAAWVWKRTAGWERAQERLSLDESLEIQARLFHRAVPWIFLVLSVVFTAGAAFSLTVNPDQRVVDGTNLAISLACVVFSWRMLRFARRPR